MAETVDQWAARQPDLSKIADPMVREQTLESWQKERPGYVDPMNYDTYEQYAGAANIPVGKDVGNDLQNRANFYGMTIENYQNALSGDQTRPMGQYQQVYGSELLSPIEQIAAQTARAQGIGQPSARVMELAQANPDVFNAASQKYQNYFTNTYPGTLEYESALSGPMQFSGAGVKYPEIKDTASMYILDRRTGQYVKNPNYKPPIRAAGGGVMSSADSASSKGLGGLDAGDVNFLRPALGGASQREALRTIDIFNDYFRSANISPEQGEKLVQAAVNSGAKIDRDGNTVMTFKLMPPNAAQVYFFSVDELEAFSRSMAKLLASLHQSGIRVVYMNKVDPTIVKALQATGIRTQQSDRPDNKIMAML